MKKNKLVIGCLIVGMLGLILISVGLLMGGRLYGVSLGSNGLVINSSFSDGNTGIPGHISENKELESFTNLKVNLSFMDMKICESDSFKLEYRVREDRNIETQLQGDTMVITQKTHNGSFSIMSIGSVSFSNINENEYMVLYVPKGTKFGSVELIDDCGDIDLDALCADNLIVDIDFGDLTISDLVVNSADIDMESGEVKLGEVETDTLGVTNSFGDVNLGTITADKVNIKVDSGDCIMKDLSGNDIKLDLEFGEASLNLREAAKEYSCDVNVEFGEIIIDGKEYGTVYFTESDGQKRYITINMDSGDVEIQGCEER